MHILMTVEQVDTAMKRPHVIVPLCEGAHASIDALTLTHAATIGGIECHVALPGPHPSWVTEPGPLEPPYDEHHRQEPAWPQADWGYINDGHSVTIRSVGLVLVSTSIPQRDELIAFDRAIARWKHLLLDWLSVIAGGPTDFLEPGQGETIWGSPEPNRTLLYAPYHAGEIHEPHRISRWEWGHALMHASSGDQPPLAQTLLTTAMRAAATGQGRLAVIDAATAAEVALTVGLTARISAQASSAIAKACIDRTRMLGRRLSLAESLGMELPDGVRPALVERRNTVVHGGSDVTDSDARTAIAVAQELVDKYEPLPTHCREPEDQSHGRSKIMM
jgi:hypothetical protein